jgi:hypothetical protein
VDGIDDITGAWADVEYTRQQYTALINTRVPIPSPLEMDLDVEFGARGDTGTVYIEVVATDSIVFTKMKLRTCLVESNIYWDGDYHNQMARDYLPTQAGVLVEIAEGDTFNHSVDFVIDPTWVVEECEIVAFVQNGKTEALYPYEMVQSIHGPVFVPVPDEVTDLTVTLVESDLKLEWSPVETDTSGYPITVDSYQIYRDTEDSLPTPDTVFSTSDTFFVDDTGVVGDTGTQYYYAVTAVLGSKESNYSEAAGEFDRYLATGK